MWRVEDVVPTRPVPRAAVPARSLPTAEREVQSVSLHRADGTTGTVADVLRDTWTDAFAVLLDGALVHESYASTEGPGSPHAVMSVTKSLVGCVAGILLDRTVLREDAPVESVVPELAESGYAGATVRHLLDMRSGGRRPGPSVV